MTNTTRFLASAAVGSFVVVGAPLAALAQQGPVRAAISSPLVRLSSSAAPGSISGIVRDERGTPIPHVVVSALGAVTTVAVTDANGRFDFGSLTPGPYLVRAHLAGYAAPRAQMIQVKASARAVSTIALRREGTAEVLAAGMASAPEPLITTETLASGSPATETDASASGKSTDGDVSETAWRIRHARRSILKDATVPEMLLADDDGVTASGWLLGQLVGTPGRVVDFFAGAPISGQVNLLTSGSFDSPQELFSSNTTARNIANVRIGAPTGADADWNVTGALTQADISSWVVAGAYSTRAAVSRHRYDLGLSYSTQRYDGGNPLAWRGVTDGSRNVGTIFGYDTIALRRDTTIAVGAEYGRFDYLASRSLISPRAELTISPNSNTRLTASVSSRSLAPGAEEFLPPGDAGIWLPPQRTFSTMNPRGEFRAERTLAANVGLERDFGAATVAVRGFSQRVANQLVTVFDGDVPGQPSAKIGHYLVGNTGDVNARGMSAEFRALVASRVHGSIRYTVARAQILDAGDAYVMLLAPLAATAGRSTLHDVTARVETQVPETNTRVMILYRASNGFAQPGPRSDKGSPTSFDGRFDVQVRQSLPFMNFCNARWEMLLAVRNFFRDASIDQSLYDELYVVRPPKRVVGGVSLHF